MSKIITHNEYNREQAIINLPISVLRSCKTKSTLRAVALSLFIKAHNGDSILRDTSVRNLMRVLHCGQRIATQCLYSLNNDTKYFMPISSNAFIAKSFKSHIKRAKNRNNRTIYECYCYKMTIKKDWSLRNIETHLRDALLTYAINAKERKEISSNSKSNSKRHSLSNSSDWLTFNKLANISGYSRSTVRRHICSLENDKKVSVKRGSTKILSAASNEALAYLGVNNHVVISHNGLAMIFTPNEYHIADGKITDAFTNIIYNHKGRHSMNRNAATLSYYERMEH